MLISLLVSVMSDQYGPDLAMVYALLQVALVNVVVVVNHSHAYHYALRP